LTPYEVYGDKEESFYFRKKIKPKLMIGFNVILNTEKNWEWSFLAWTMGRSAADVEVILKENIFYQKGGYEEIEDINHLFHTLIEEVKNDSHYRLKMLNTLTEEIVKVWSENT